MSAYIVRATAADASIRAFAINAKEMAETARAEMASSEVRETVRAVRISETEMVRVARAASEAVRTDHLTKIVNRQDRDRALENQLLLRVVLQVKLLQERMLKSTVVKKNAVSARKKISVPRKIIFMRKTRT